MGSQRVEVGREHLGDESDRDLLGDNGGPAVATLNEPNTLIGIVSFGSGAGCQVGHEQGYTKVLKFIDWIEDNSDVRFPL